MSDTAKPPKEISEAEFVQVCELLGWEVWISRIDERPVSIKVRSYADGHEMMLTEPSSVQLAYARALLMIALDIRVDWQVQREQPR